QLAPWVGAVGRDGLVCFVAGAVISLIVDSVLFTLTGGLLDVPYGFAADAIAIGLLLAIPHRQRLFDALGFGSMTSAAKAKG
ncbi:OpgC domain-containing protein, partial [Caballeronia sp. M23-90]